MRVAALRRSLAVAPKPRDQDAELGDIELRETSLDFDESQVYAGRPSDFNGGQVAAAAARSVTLGDDGEGALPR